jgi:hypothetical protein
VDPVTFADRSAAVEALGFTPRQAAFLTTVALHSGYCLGRQYAACAGLKNAKSVRAFVECLVERKLANRIVFRADRGSVYHLISKRLYAAMGHADSRNRRAASPQALARKLMVLDLALAHPELDWFPTQADRIGLFVTRLRVPSSIRVPNLKVPIFLHGASSCVHFVCLVTDPRASSIGLFIRDHAPLLHHLTDWTLNALVPQRVSTDQACDAAYRRALDATAMSLVAASREDFEWFAKTRPLVASGDLRTLDMGDLHRYRVLASSLDQQAETRTVKPLVVHHLPHSYTQFGFFAGLT